MSPPTRTESSPRRNQLIFIGLAAAILIAAAAIGIGFIMSSGGDGNSGGEAVAQGDCTTQTFDALEARHVEELPGDYEYNSIPATSGLHVTPNFFFLQWMLFLVKPVVTIGPYKQEIPWSRASLIPLPPGQYTVTFRNPQASQPVSKTATVTAANTESVLAEFRPVTTAEYFKKAGF